MYVENRTHWTTGGISAKCMLKTEHIGWWRGKSAKCILKTEHNDGGQVYGGTYMKNRTPCAAGETGVRCNRRA